MIHRHLLVATLTALLVPAAAAHADTLVAPSPGAVNLAAGGGWMAWGVPGEDIGWKLVVRAPDGTISTPGPLHIGAPRPAIGSTAIGRAPRRLVAVYERRDPTGTDSDIFQLDLVTGRESPVPGLATSRYRESAPSIEYGTITFVRRAGARNGVHIRQARSGRIRRISADTPRTTSFNGSRVAYAQGRSVVVHRVSGRERRPIVQRTEGVPRDVELLRYRVGWLLADGRVFRTPRFGGSGTRSPVGAAVEGTRALPAATQSFAAEGPSLRLYADPEGVKRATPSLFAGGA